MAALCRLDCVDDGCGPPDRNGGQHADPMGETYGDEDELARTPGRPREGLVTFSADTNLALITPALRSGEVWHLSHDLGSNRFRKVTMDLHPNGFSVKPIEDEHPEFSITWSPFSLVQACRLHSDEADKAQPWMRLFKISIFHHGLTHFFATSGKEADLDRARWVADVSRALRSLTQSLYQPFRLRVEPLDGMEWTTTRLLAGYLLLYDELGVSRVYGELHCELDGGAMFNAYEDEHCDVQVLNLLVDTNTCISERVGVDCGCFSVGDHHFAARTCAEKALWLRAISNIKVKLRHKASNPTASELRSYRAAVFEHIRKLPRIPEEEIAERGPLLPRKVCMPVSSGYSGIANGAHADPLKPQPVATQATLVTPSSGGTRL